MATDYGTDIAALTDLPDPEVLVSGPLAVAYAVARRWLTPSGGLIDIGDTSPYSSFDVREYLGSRVSDAMLSDLGRKAVAAASQDDRVQSAAVTVTFAVGRLALAATLTLADGPFEFVLTVDAVSASLLLGQ